MRAYWKSAYTWAHWGLVVQFLALIRCLVEYFRLKYLEGAGYDPKEAEIFIVGALVAALFTAAGVWAYVAKKPKFSFVLACAMVAALIALKALWPIRIC